MLLRADELQRVTEEPGAAETGPLDDRATELRDINLQKRLERRRGQSLLTRFQTRRGTQAATAHDLASEDGWSGFA